MTVCRAAPTRRLPLLRWRLKKSVPFDVDETVVSWMRQAGRAGKSGSGHGRGPQGNHSRIRGDRREPGRAHVHRSEFHTGHLAAARRARRHAACPHLRQDADTVIVNGSNLCVYRATEMLAEADILEPQAVLEEIFPAIAYYQDTWGGTIDRARLGGFRAARARISRGARSRIAVAGCFAWPIPKARANLNSPASDMLHQNLDALVGWMLNEGPEARLRYVLEICGHAWPSGDVCQSCQNLSCSARETAMKLRLNLSTTPQENHRPFIAGAVAVGTVGLLALLVLSHAAYSSWQSNRELRAEIAHWQQQIQR